MGGKRTRTHRPPDVPVELPPHVRELLGAEADQLLLELQRPAPVSIRGNPSKPIDLPGMPVPWCAQGRYLDERPIFTLDPLFHAGAYYVQEASSMLVEQAFRAAGPLRDDAVVLDLCAAPGGKSTHLAALIPSGAWLISNEPVRTRQTPLMENLWKWGRHNAAVTGAEPEDFAPLGAFCDLVLVDAPCSGEGMFRKDPHARAQWGPNLVESCAARQRNILDAAWAALKPGGRLIYSTCTWETSENEDQVQRLVDRGAEIVPIPVDPSWGIQASSVGLRCWPHRVRGEGFFIAVLRKPVGEMEGMGVASNLRTTFSRARSRSHEETIIPLQVNEWLNGNDQLTGIVVQDVLYAVDQCRIALIEAMMAEFAVPAPGIPIAMRKGGAWLPHPALALNQLLKEEAFATLDLDKMQALQYLRGEALPATAAEGTVLVCHQGLPLGWANGAGKRYNNRWPAPWRIRMR